MTSFANLSMPSGSTPSTSQGSFGTSHSSPERTNNLSLHRLQSLSRLTLQSGLSSSSIPSMFFDPYNLPSTSAGPSTSSLFEFNNATNGLTENHTDSSVGLVRTSPSLPITCSQCETVTPTTRCSECNELYCYECCCKHRSICQQCHNALWPIHQIFSSYTTDRDTMQCDIHKQAATFCCTSCTELICQDCTLYFHKDHNYSALITNIDDKILFDMKSLFKASKKNTKAIKSAIDKALAMIKAYEKETNETSMQIKSAMNYFVTSIVDHEKNMLSQVEKMRHSKINQLTEYMDTLRGILAGLSHTNETLVRSITAQGMDVTAANDMGKQEIESFASTFRKFWVKEEKIIFTCPGKDLMYEFQRQCKVHSILLRSITPALEESLQLTPRSNRSDSSSSYRGSDTSSLYRGSDTSSLYRGSDTSSLYRGSDTSSLYRGSDTASLHLDSPPIPLGYLPPPLRSHRSHEPVLSSRVSMDVVAVHGGGQAIPGLKDPVLVHPPRSKTSGTPIFSFGPEGSAIGHVSRPWGLCVDKDGNFIVADRRNNRIQIFNSQGEFMRMFGSKGTGPGEFELPAGITTDPYGRIIVVDKDNHRVQIFTTLGRFAMLFGSQGKEIGEFQYPWDVAVNSLGIIAVTDTRNHRIQLFSSEGAYITKYVFEGGTSGRILKGPTTPRGICFTTSGNIVVSDFENHRLIVVDPNSSRILTCFGSEGSSMNEFNRPSGMICDDLGNLIVADSKNHRLLLLNADFHVMQSVNLKSPGLDDKDRPCDVALTPEGYLVVLFETLPDNAREQSHHRKLYIKIY